MRSVLHAAAEAWWRGGESARQALRDRSRRYGQADRPLRIDELISPLRWDILVRADFFEFLHSNLELALREPATFTDAAADQPYAIWFDEVVVPRLGKRLRSPAARRRAFHQRVRRTVHLDRRFARWGFDERHPISVRRVDRLVTKEGKRLVDRHYPVDGCHRIALLLVHGYREIPAPWYRIVHEIERVPPDNTHVLVRRLKPSEAEYSAFVARGYGISAAGRASLLATAQACHPERADEIARLFEVDGPFLTRQS